MMEMIRKLSSALITFFVITVISFSVVELLPGDPAAALVGSTATQQELKDMRKYLGVDDPVLTRYGRFLLGIVDPKVALSYRTRRPVLLEIAERMPNTLIIAIGGIVVGVAFGVTTGIICALRQGGWFDAIVTILTLAGISMPIYWLGLLAIWLFAVKLNWLPAAGAASPAHFVLPILAVATRPAALFSRLTTASLLEVMTKDYLDTARSKGLKESDVILKHALRNSMVAAISVIGVQFGGLLGGAVVTETVFAVPGIGRLLVDAAGGADYPVVQYCVLMFAVFFIIVNSLTDLASQWLDPRTRQFAMRGAGA